MKYRISEEMYFQIFNDATSIEDLDKMGFDLMVDLYGDIMTSYDGYFSKGITLDMNNKKEVIICSLYNYLFKIMNTYMKLISGSHRVGATILSRTIYEIDIKIRFFLMKEDEELYNNYINSSLIAEKFYLKELDGMKSFEKDFMDGTKKSILNY